MAVWLALGMFGFQASIGALNDLVDLERDRLTRPRKPIPSGHVSTRAARTAVLLGGAAGVAVSASFGPTVLIAGLIGAGAGYGYDLAPRRAIAGPLAFAIALPALLAWTWLAAAGSLPPGWPMLLPLAALAGPTVHLANSMADLDDDVRSGATSLATRLGRRRSRIVLLVLDGAVWTLAWLSLAILAPLSIVVLAVMIIGTTVAGAGALLSVSPRMASSSAGWMLGAVALAVLAVTWAATAAAV